MTSRGCANPHPGPPGRETGVTPRHDQPTGTALFDRTGAYRYRLSRTWDETATTVAWVMLNPSTATAIAEDNTIRRVVGFSREWGHGKADVVNLFAFRSPDPAALIRVHDPVGPDNDGAIVDVVSTADHVVLAWGNRGEMANPLTGVARHREVTDLIGGLGRRVSCLGWTIGGQPRHPLYVRSDAAPIPFV